MLESFLVDDHIKSALKEDINFWDITTDYLASDDDKMTVYLKTRVDGVLCGISIFEKVFQILDNEISIEKYFKDGDLIKKGDVLAKLEGSAKTILKGERTALNYIQRMSGIATETRMYKDKMNSSAKIVDTRKTTPNFRIFEKYSVLIGGGTLHRFNLTDCVMIKDNHIALAGSIEKAVSKIRQKLSHAHKIEVECDTLEQVKSALDCNVEIIMLDNMTIDEIKNAVKIINKRAIVEVSGNVNSSTIKEISDCGVDIISSSSIVAGAKTLDLALDK
ncbi:MAG: carboxylating nicotinate-nucleotide diphosphorylase [Candidatus Melainabacteria bacterium]|nr:MAG: carboxylating nicotinate-nucleotide diphosphorylase [Candidatus Melainabacteria bacterium]